MPKYFLPAVFTAAVFQACSPSRYPCRAQGETTSAISGQAKDETGSAVSQVQVTIFRTMKLV